MPKLILTRHKMDCTNHIYYDTPASASTWKRNLDILFEEDEEKYISGTISKNDSTSALKLELRQISKYF